MTDKNLPAVAKANTIRKYFDQPSIRQELMKALPKHLPVDRLLRVAMTSIQRTPKLMDCDMKSLLACVMTCAQLGLEPDQFLGQAYLVPFWNEKKKVFEATLIPGYRGYIALARRSGEVQSVAAQVVYSSDVFEMEYGLDERLKHIPAEGDRGAPTGAYVVFKYKDGSHSFDYMSAADIEKIRARSKAANSGPWVTDWDEMAKKTVIKRHAKLAPLSVEFQHATQLEEAAHAGESQMGIFRDISGEEPEQLEAPTDEAALAEFGHLTKDMDQIKLAAFIKECAAQFERAENDVRIGAALNFASFKDAFDKWSAKNQKPAEPAYPFANLKATGIKEWWKGHEAELRASPIETRTAWNKKVLAVSLIPAERSIMTLPLEAPTEPELPKTETLGGEQDKEGPRPIACPDRQGDMMDLTYCDENCQKKCGAYHKAAHEVETKQDS